MSKTALVTGASSGIGAEMAVCLAKRGMNLVLTARREDRLEALKKRIIDKYPVQVDLVKADLADRGGPELIINVITERALDIDILINNAGLGRAGEFKLTDGVSEENSILVNVLALTVLTKKILPMMLKKKAGYILNVGSIVGFMPGPFMNVYSATKAYVLSFTRALRHELKGSNIHVSVLCPGSTKSEYHAKAGLSLNAAAQFNLMEAPTVAELGILGLLNNKEVIVPGAVNKIQHVLMSILPGSISIPIFGKAIQRILK